MMKMDSLMIIKARFLLTGLKLVELLHLKGLLVLEDLKSKLESLLFQARLMPFGDI